MNMDIVKPMPPKRPAPIIFLHLKSDGNVHSPNPAPINENRKIPKGFPIISPAMIPKLLTCVNPLSQLSPIAIQVLATANNGTIKNPTGLCKIC